MPKVKVFPHRELCPKGAEIEAKTGQSLCEALLEHKVKIEHACELSCACTTCHVIVRKGFGTLNESTDDEEEGWCCENIVTTNDNRNNEEEE